MKYIANILTDKPFIDNELYNVVDSKDKLIGGIPTLVVGWDYTKRLYGNASILDWSIDRNTYWTYGKREKRNRYDENIVNFRKLAMTKFIKSVKYKYYSIITISDDDKKYILGLLSKDSGSNIYLAHDMVYVLDNVENVVIGFSLKDIDYVGKDRKKIFSMIYKNKNNVIIDIKDGLSYDAKSVLSGYSYVIPYLYG
jgi:hypothetical protein